MTGDPLGRATTQEVPVGLLDDDDDGVGVGVGVVGVGVGVGVGAVTGVGDGVHSSAECGWLPVGVGTGRLSSP